MNRTWLLSASLAPVLGATATLAQAMLTATCTLLLIAVHQGLMTALRGHLTPAAGAIASLLLAAALGTCLQLSLQAWALPLSLMLGHYPALIALQCLSTELLLPARQRWRHLCAGGVSVLLACLALGLCRQVLTELGVHMAALAPGALILLGLLLGLYNRLRPAPSSSRRQGTL